MSGRSRFTNSISSGSGTPSAYSTSVELAARPMHCAPSPRLPSRTRLTPATTRTRGAFGWSLRASSMVLPTVRRAMMPAVRGCELDALNRPRRHTVEEDPGIRPQFAPVPAYEMECRLALPERPHRTSRLCTSSAAGPKTPARSRRKANRVSIECFGEELESPREFLANVSRIAASMERNAGRVGSTR